MHSTPQAIRVRNGANFPRFPKALIAIIDGRGDRVFGRLT